MNVDQVELRRSDLCEIVDAVLTTMLQTGTVPLPEGTLPLHFELSEVWNGRVNITGAFRGAVIVTCTREFAFQIARSMFGSDSLNDDDAKDALGELTNIIGGGVKCLMSNLVESPCQLSLPEVDSDTSLQAGAREIRELWANCDGHQLGVAVMAS